LFPAECSATVFYVIYTVVHIARSTELDSVSGDITENDDDVDSDEDSGVLKNCNNGQGMVTCMVLSFEFRSNVMVNRLQGWLCVYQPLVTDDSRIRNRKSRFFLEI